MYYTAILKYAAYIDLLIQTYIVYSIYIYIYILFIEYTEIYLNTHKYIYNIIHSC